MRIALALLLMLASVVVTRAQVINGESTDDARYAPRPPARWHSPEQEGEVPGGRLDDDSRDAGARSVKPRE